MPASRAAPSFGAGILRRRHPHHKAAPRQRLRETLVGQHDRIAVGRRDRHPCPEEKGARGGNGLRPQAAPHVAHPGRSEEGRVGEECDRQGGCWWWPDYKKKKKYRTNKTM